PAAGRLAQRRGRAHPGEVEDQKDGQQQQGYRQRKEHITRHTCQKLDLACPEHESLHAAPTLQSSRTLLDNRNRMREARTLTAPFGSHTLFLAERISPSRGTN